MQTSATAIFTICFNGCPQLALSALYNTSRLISSSRETPSIKGLSLCAVTNRQIRRLIMLALHHACIDTKWFRLFSEQIIIHHLACDWCCRAPTVTAIFNQYSQRYLWLFG